MVCDRTTDSVVTTAQQEAAQILFVFKNTRWSKQTIWGFQRWHELDVAQQQGLDSPNCLTHRLPGVSKMDREELYDARGSAVQAKHLAARRCLPGSLLGKKSIPRRNIPALPSALYPRHALNEHRRGLPPRSFAQRCVAKSPKIIQLLLGGNAPPVALDRDRAQLSPSLILLDRVFRGHCSQDCGEEGICRIFPPTSGRAIYSDRPPSPLPLGCWVTQPTIQCIT